MQFLEAQGTQSPNLGREIPIDLLIEIFSRVPAKTIAKLRCLSKFWRSLLDRPDFTDLFLTRSSSLLLFTFRLGKNIYFFSLAHPQNPDESMCLIPTRYQVQQKRSSEDSLFELGSSLCGFICRRDMGREDTIVISNPVTGETISLPKVELKNSDEAFIRISIRPYLGYDPIDKQLKVLCIKFKGIGNTCDEHQVLTLKNGNHSWRTIQCKPHVPKSVGICIAGILYYTAGYYGLTDCSMIVCFDVKSEKFRFIDLDVWMVCGTLINYKGKLGVLDTAFGLELWILDDAEKCVWSKKIYTLPPLLKNLYIVGMTNKGEVVLSMTWIVDLFYIYYFNLESNHVTRVQIQGFEVFRGSRVHSSLDYAENLKFM